MFIQAEAGEGWQGMYHGYIKTILLLYRLMSTCLRHLLSWGLHSVSSLLLFDTSFILNKLEFIQCPDMQPMLMPLLKEMPGGPGGVAVSRRAVHFVLFFVACAAYGTVGIFGASIFGQETESNIMVRLIEGIVLRV